jgi:hypothetical protein
MCLKNNEASDAVWAGLARMFPEQAVRTLPTGHALCSTDEERVLEGKGFYIQGRALAKIAFACQLCQEREIFFYLVASSENPYVVDDVFVPAQNVSCSHCRVEGRDVLRAGRFVRSLGKRIVGAAHSHGFADVYSSSIDRGQMTELARESAGWVSNAQEMIRGEIFAGEVPKGAAPSSLLQARFTGLNGQFTIRGMTIPLGVADVEVSMQHTVRQVVSTFITSNARGQHFVPMLKVRSCPVCGSSREQFVEASDVQVCVVGPVDLSEEDTCVLRDELAERVRLFGWSSGAGEYCGSSWYDSTAGHPCVKPAPFEIYHRNRWVCSIPAVVMEELAAKNRELAKKLGWTD